MAVDYFPWTGQISIFGTPNFDARFFIPAGSDVLAGAPTASLQTYAAGGIEQSDATQLATQINIVVSTPGGSGVRLTGALGVMMVENRGANQLLVYPPAQAQIELLGVNLPMVIPLNGSAQFVQTASNQWWST